MGALAWLPWVGDRGLFFLADRPAVLVHRSTTANSDGRNNRDGTWKVVEWLQGSPRNFYYYYHCNTVLAHHGGSGDT